jgi:hypothetical protein
MIRRVIGCYYPAPAEITRGSRSIRRPSPSTIAEIGRAAAITAAHADPGFAIAMPAPAQVGGGGKKHQSDDDKTAVDTRVAHANSRAHSIAKTLETIATGLLSAALDRVTRPKPMVRPSRTTRASASTSDEVMARMKCVV